VKILGIIGEQMKMITKNIPFRFLILVGLWIIELQILTTVIEIDRNYDTFTISMLHRTIWVILTALLISLSYRIVNALFVCFVCFKKYSLLLKTYSFIFFVSFDVINAIVFTNYFFKSGRMVFFMFITCLFLYLAFFIFILVKINREKGGLIEYLCFVLNTIFVMMFVPIYSTIVLYNNYPL
jgi:hypothetical protein